MFLRSVSDSLCSSFMNLQQLTFNLDKCSLDNFVTQQTGNATFYHMLCKFFRQLSITHINFIFSFYLHLISNVLAILNDDAHKEISSLQQPCHKHVRLQQGCHKVVAFCARCSQPCRVVITLYDGCKVVFQIEKLISQVNVKVT